jgi:putative transcriptional regulator
VTTLKTKIREYRARQGLTQEELAKKVGVRRETIVFLEKGKYNPSLFLAYKIAKVLNESIEHLFIFEEESESKAEEAPSHEHHKRSYIP